MIAMNILAAKAKKTVLNVSPSGCGKSVSTDTVARLLHGRAKKFTSLTLAGLIRLKTEFSQYAGHISIDDLGAEKSLWSRIHDTAKQNHQPFPHLQLGMPCRSSTITVLANLTYGHHVRKITHTGEIRIDDFEGSVSLNIQPVLMNSLVQSTEWIAVVRDKVLRYYHLLRPAKPKSYPPSVKIDWGTPMQEVSREICRGKLWYQLIAIGLTQWSYSRCLEHIPDLLRACAALDARTRVRRQDYSLLIKLLQPLQLERYIIDTYSFESGRVFKNNLYCILVEIASFPHLTLEQLAIDYKIQPAVVEQLCLQSPQYVWIEANSPKKVKPTDLTEHILDIVGVNQKW